MGISTKYDLLGGEKMFVKTVIKQGVKLHSLERELYLEKEANANLREENEELLLELRRLRIFKANVVFAVKGKGTIVERCDKIEELVDNLQTEN